MRTLRTIVILALVGAAATPGAVPQPSGFTRIQLTDQFWSEGANAGDLNNDGIKDIVAGPWWWQGPDFKMRHEYYPATSTFQLKLGPQTTVTVPGFEGALGRENKYSEQLLRLDARLQQGRLERHPDHRFSGHRTRRGSRIRKVGRVTG